MVSWRNHCQRRTRRLPSQLGILVALAIYALLMQQLQQQQQYDDVMSSVELVEGWNTVDISTSFNSRHLLSTNDTNDSPAAAPPATSCTSSIDEYPFDSLTKKQRQHGGVILYMIFAGYLFIGLAIVCDEYFVAALEQICDSLGLSEDVAGATFMAAGGSAPELASSFLGTFLTKSDLGFGTIVGSATFNVLAVIGLCSLFTLEPLPLTWFPLFRDCVYYCLSILVLVVFIRDNEVYWYEALILFILYLLYIVLMYFNPRLQTWAMTRRDKVKRSLSRRFSKYKGDAGDATTTATENGESPLSYRASSHHGDQASDKKSSENNSTNIEMCTIRHSCDVSKSPPIVLPPPTISNGRLSMLLRSPGNGRMRRMASMRDIAWKVMLASRRPRSRWRAAGNILIDRLRMINGWEAVALHSSQESLPDIKSSHHGDVTSIKNAEVDDTPDSVWVHPEKDSSWIAWSKYILLLPLNVLFYYTILDCRRSMFKRFYMITFFSSVLWIGVLAYWLVWAVVVIGDTLGIPDTVMGVTFLAAGTSIPDALSSIFVAREGYGDMAVSSSIGSNIFDILIGLPIPWLIKTAFVDPGSFVLIRSDGLIYSIGLLFFMVLAVIVSIHCSGWQLNKRLGIICGILYAIFLIFSLLFEFNVFGEFNHCL